MAAVSVNSAGGETSTGPVTLTAGAADTVTFNQDVDVIRVIADVSGTTEVNIRVDGGSGGGRRQVLLPPDGSGPGPHRLGRGAEGLLGHLSDSAEVLDRKGLVT
jgi:hypothetical protein